MSRLSIQIYYDLKKSLHPFFNKYNARKYLLSSGSKIFVWFVGIN